ncbi:YhcH/YjgK/YiaL family protein, partial [Campylobacter jejuni]|nr:YhcH/YjgK/YiaL family protein [Campylobacter jejuni]
IQLHLSGIEQMEFNNINSFKISKPYDAARDLIIYEDNNYSNKIIMQKNDIAIFFPEDAHLGTAMYNKTPSNILKTVIKYPLRLWR